MTFQELLRFLMSKESAISLVADEYIESCANLLEKLERRHERERSEVIKILEQERAAFVDVCNRARREIGTVEDRLDPNKQDELVANLEESSSAARLRAFLADTDHGQRG